MDLLLLIVREQIDIYAEKFIQPESNQSGNIIKAGWLVGEAGRGRSSSILLLDPSHQLARRRRAGRRGRTQAAPPRRRRRRRARRHGGRVLTSGAADPPRAGRPHGWIGGGQPSSRLAAALLPLLLLPLLVSISLFPPLFLCAAPPRVLAWQGKSALHCTCTDGASNKRHLLLTALVETARCLACPVGPLLLLFLRFLQRIRNSAGSLDSPNQ